MKISRKIIAGLKKNNFNKVVNLSEFIYVIINYSEKDWSSFFKRQCIIKNDINYLDKLYQFLKYNSDHLYWHNYIMDAYVKSSYDVIYLTGIPDLKGSKPHEIDY